VRRLIFVCSGTFAVAHGDLDRSMCQSMIDDLDVDWAMYSIVHRFNDWHIDALIASPMH
jgi:hypothetical protein